MTMRFNKAFLLISCLALSVLVHIICFYAWMISGTYDFTTPVTPPTWVEVDMTQQAAPVSSAEAPDLDDDDVSPPEQDADSDSETEQDQAPEEKITPKTVQSTVLDAEKPPAPPHVNEAARKTTPDAASRVAKTPPPPLGRADEFLTTAYEKLTYVISIFGLPVGTAELEAKNVNSEVWITLSVKSNAAISSFYPVDNLVETRHIDGKFILTKIRQHEGSFKSDESFTINLTRKKVSWVDNIGGRSQTVTVPVVDVLDTLSGIYYLRTRQLQVGKSETLHIFDSEFYADVPVEILRRETVRLPNFTKVDTLVVQPLQKSAGIFRRTGDILIWMTDDVYKVPVKIVSSVALGTVTVELVSADSKSPEEKTKQLLLTPRLP